MATGVSTTSAACRARTTSTRSGRVSKGWVASVAALFPLGRLVATPGALALLRRAGEDHLTALLERHRSGDWGDVPPEDARENEFSVRYGFRVLSSYRVAEERLLVVTEADRSVTTFLLSEEY